MRFMQMVSEDRSYYYGGLHSTAPAASASAAAAADACALVQLQGMKEGIREVGEVVVRLGRDDEMY